MTVAKHATISACGTYRYTLARIWDESKYCLPIVMLNPSTADADKDDPTIRRCIRFARRENFGGIYVVNLFAARSASPLLLSRLMDPVGPENDHWLRVVKDVAKACGNPILCAWGAHPMVLSSVAYVLRGAELVCLGKTVTGFPRHPLYVPSDQPFMPYP